MTTSYEIGDKPVVTITCRTIAGALADPTLLTVEYTCGAPAVKTSFVYNPATSTGSPEIGHTSTGVFTFTLPTIAVPGTHQLKFTGTGTVAASEQDFFDVIRTNQA